MRLYVAGPMTGRPRFNFPAFDDAATMLRERGHDVVSPAEIDDPETRAAAMASPDGAPGSGTTNGETWGDFLARDVKLIADEGIEGIVVLPGWEESRGARLETFVGHALCGLPVYYLPGAHAALPPVPPGVLARAWAADQLAASAAAHDFALDPAAWDEDPAELVRCPDPSGEVRVTNASTGGQKGRKPQRMGLLPWDVLMDDVAPLYAAGAEKYDDNNWRKGYDWSLSIDALGRHLAQFVSGEDYDSETKCKHLASVVFHACALMFFMEAHPDLDDRWRPAPERVANPAPWVDPEAIREELRLQFAAPRSLNVVMEGEAGPMKRAVERLRRCIDDGRLTDEEAA